MYKISIIVFIVTIFFQSCENNKVEDVNKPTDENSYILNLPNGVSWSDITSTILLQRNKIIKSGNTINTFGINADFYSSSDYAVDAGNVIMNGDTLVKTSTAVSNNQVYTYTSFDSVALNQNYVFNITGSGNYVSFNTNIQTPTSDVEITSLSPNNNISKSSNLILTWNGSYQTDAQIRIVIESNSHVFRTITDDDGTFTIPSTALANLNNGNGKISVYRTKFNLYQLSNSKYSLLAALTSQTFDINITN